MVGDDRLMVGDDRWSSRSWRWSVTTNGRHPPDQSRHPPDQSRHPSRQEPYSGAGGFGAPAATGGAAVRRPSSSTATKRERRWSRLQLRFWTRQRWFARCAWHRL